MFTQIRLSHCVLGLVALFALSACNQSGHSVSMADVQQAPAPIAEVSGELTQVTAEVSKVGSAVAPPEQKRYLALKYSLTLENEAEALERSWKTISERCRQLQCDILEGSFTRSHSGMLPQGFLHVRIEPKKLNEFMQATEQNGIIISNTMSSEDKTAQVVDTEARLKNMTELRDRLRTMMQNRSGPLKDVLEVERELANVQSQIDSLNGTRKALSAETDKTEMTIEFVSRSRFVDSQKVSPLREAWDNMAEVFLRSVSALILFVAAVAPWLVALAPVIWFIRRCWRKRRERRS